MLVWHLFYILFHLILTRMPNTFAPVALEDVTKDRAKELRVAYDGNAAEIKDWHAIVDMLEPEATEAFKAEYSRTDEIPSVVNGFGDDEGDETETEE